MYFGDIFLSYVFMFVSLWINVFTGGTHMVILYESSRKWQYINRELMPQPHIVI